MFSEFNTVEPQPVIEIVDQSSGRGPFDSQPRVLCGDCNSSWMTKHEDIAGPALAEMITSPHPTAATEEQCYAIAAWAVAALFIRSRMSKDLPRIRPEIMKRFRTDGLEQAGASVAVLRLANTRAVFPGDAVGSTYISDVDEPDRSVLGLFFFQSIVVAVGIGKFTNYVEKAGIAFNNAALAAWPQCTTTTVPQPAAEVSDRVLVEAFGLEGFSRSTFVAPNHVRGTSKRAVIRVPEALAANEITIDQQLIIATHAFPQVIAKQLSRCFR